MRITAKSQFIQDLRPDQSAVSTFAVLTEECGDSTRNLSVTRARHDEQRKSGEALSCLGGGLNTQLKGKQAFIHGGKGHCVSLF